MIQELKIQQKLDEVDQILVQKAEEFVNNTEIFKQLDTSQLRNLMAASLETRSLEVLKNFIKYQIGRNKWEKDTGEELLKELDEISNISKSFIKDKDLDVQELQIRMIRRYIGYLVRYFVYKKRGG